MPVLPLSARLLIACGVAVAAIITIAAADRAGQVAPAPYQDPALSPDVRAADLVSRLTVEEKISQLTNEAAAIPRLGVPAYEWWNEALHGVARAGAATVFPQAIGMAAAFDTALMHEVATAIGNEARAKHHEFVRRGQRGRYQGLTFWSPNINIFRDPRWGRGQETYGEDPFLTARMGVAFVKGLQGDDPRYLKVAATAKHYAVHSGPEADRHRFDARPNERDLFETYLPAFRALVQDAKVEAVMSAYNRDLAVGVPGEGQAVAVSVQIRNAGTRAGDEVVQLYTRAVDPKRPRAIRELRGFARVALQPGEEKALRFRLVPSEDFSYHDEVRKGPAVDPGEYEVQVGASSADIRLTSRIRLPPSSLAKGEVKQ